MTMKLAQTLVGEPLRPPAVSTLNEALARAAASAFGLTFIDIHEREQRVTWSEILHRARRMAAALAERGVQVGHRVALVLPTGLDFMDAFFGTLLCGAVPVPLYPPVRLGRMDEYNRMTATMLRTSDACLVLTDARIRLLLGVAVGLHKPSLGCRTVAELMDGRNEHGLTVRPTALGLIQFSSGSTVDPKPVALTHETLMAQVAMLTQVMPELNAETGGVSWLPLYHDMGLIGCLMEAAYFPGNLALLAPEVFVARPALWFRTISKFRGVVSAAPNFAYSLCVKRIKDEDMEGVDLSCWRYALNGAEPISDIVQQRFIERFSKWGFSKDSLLPVYGLSEASLAVTFTRRGTTARTVNHQGREVMSVGTPMPGTKVEIRNGRIWVQSPSVMQKYCGNAEATKKSLVNHWLDTGDLGFIDGGELFVSGRAKDIVIIRGVNYAPQMFEECLDGTPGVRAGCAVAVGYTPVGSVGEELAIFVEGEGEQLKEAVTGAIVARTAIRPNVVVVLPPGTLPRTSSGKLRRSEALRRWQAGQLKPPKPVTAFQVSTEIAKSLWSFTKSQLR